MWTAAHFEKQSSKNPSVKGSNQTWNIAISIIKHDLTTTLGDRGFGRKLFLHEPNSMKVIFICFMQSASQFRD